MDVLYYTKEFRYPGLAERYIWIVKSNFGMIARNFTHNERLKGLYSTPSIIWVMKSRGNTVSKHGRGYNCVHGLVGNSQDNGRPRRSGRRWQCSIKIVITEVDWNCVDQIYLAQDSDNRLAIVN